MNKLVISRSSAINIATVAAISRIFFGAVIDSPELMNAGWISVILGSIIASPIFVCIDQITRDDVKSAYDHINNRILQKMLAAVFIINALLDGGISARCISNSASYVAFNHAIRFYLLVPLFLATLWAIHCGGDSIGASARLWKLISPAFILIIIIAQLNQYRWTWLTPVLGPGCIHIFNGAVDVAGWLSGFAGLLILSEGKPKRKNSISYIPLTVAAATSFLIILRQMMSPVLLASHNRSRMLQLDFMLSNGRSPLLLQLPLIVIWFVSLFNLLACDCFVSAAYIRRLFPRLNSLICSFAGIILTAAMSMSYMTDRFAEDLFSSWQYVVNAASVAVAGIAIQTFKKRSYQSCERNG